MYRPKCPSRSESAETPEMTRNIPKFDPRWNKGLPRTGLHTGTRFSVRSSQNGTESITLLQTRIPQRILIKFFKKIYGIEIILNFFLVNYTFLLRGIVK